MGPMKESFQVKSSALPEGTRVAGFRGTEGISRLYQFELYLIVDSEAQDLDLADAVNAKGTFEIDHGDGSPAYVVHGIFAAFTLLHHFGEYAIFQAMLVPQLWQLTQTYHARMFTQMSIPDVIEEVLQDSGLGASDYSLKLAQTYKPEEHVCQYQESNLDFISRWMEREGMYYYFEQGDDAEKLIISDSKAFQQALDPRPVRFYALLGADVTSGEALNTFTCKHRALPASVKYKDYDYTKPTLDVTGGAPVSKVGMGEISLYGARFFTPDDGKRIAKIRAEELLAREVVYRGAGTALPLRSGYFFKLEDHPRSAFDTNYLVTDVEHSGNVSLHTPEMQALTGIDTMRLYTVEVTAIPATVQFRAESKTAWPRIFGFENGTVCGPAESEYAQIDDLGRYNVKFKFDESDLKGGKASTWVRMLQPHGGSPEGFHFPLRKGTEVLFTFLGGDPDRPVITGVVNNTHTPSPVTKGNHTTNVIQTGGRNRLELEDKAGQQRITMSTPHANSFVRMGYPNKGHTMIIQTDKASFLNAGADFDLFVGQIQGTGSWDTLVKDDWTAKVENGGFSLGVGLDQEDPAAGKVNIKSLSDIKIETTTGDHIFDVDAGTSTSTIKGDTTLHVTNGALLTNVDTGNMTTTVKAGATKIDTQAGTTDILSKGKITMTSSGSDVYIEGGTVTTHSRSDWAWTCLGTKVSFTAGSTVDFKLAQSTSFTLGLTNSVFVGVQNSFTMAANNSITIGPQASIFLGGKASISVSQEMSLTAAIKLALEASISVTLAASVAVTFTPTALKTQLTQIENAISAIKISGFELVT
jgi:type VI secretion system secreted protein VgrG